jgi:hypothetical protein
VVLTEEQLTDAEQRILEILEQSEEPVSPLHMINELTSDQTSEYALRAAIWYLIDRNEIELTWNRHLRRLPHRVA